MYYPPATRLIKTDVRQGCKWGDSKWCDFIDGGNGCLYGIPTSAHRVVEFHVEHKSMKEIGPDLGDETCKYLNAIKANNGSIYCMPYKKNFLKITPGKGQSAEVQILEGKQILRGNAEVQIRRDDFYWESGALADDDCIYYLPCIGGHILKLDPNNSDSLSLVGEEMYEGFKAAVLGNGYIYGISLGGIIKFSPTDHSLTHIGGTFEEQHSWAGGVLLGDGNIYAANDYGQILRIDTVQDNWEYIGSSLYNTKSYYWGRPVLGADKCIYFLPLCHDRVLKYNSTTQSISLIDKSCGDNNWKWEGGVLASDGFIYCVPYSANSILQIDSRHVNEQVLDMIENIYKGHEYVDDYVDEYLEGNIYEACKQTRDDPFDKQKCCITIFYGYFVAIVAMRGQETKTPDYSYDLLI